jgi:nitrite reductase/ring-hydroxylating ferredoxin subunit
MYNKYTKFLFFSVLVFILLSMKWKLILVLLIFIISCDDVVVEQNPYLPNYSFEYQLNLNLPLYDNLRFTGGTHTINDIGVKGVHLFNLNGSQLMAWEASCPNHAPNQCSLTSIKGIEAHCACDDYLYSLATGQPLTEGAVYGLVNYRVRRNGNQVLIYN